MSNKPLEHPTSFLGSEDSRKTAMFCSHRREDARYSSAKSTFSIYPTPLLLAGNPTYWQRRSSEFPVHRQYSCNHFGTIETAGHGASYAGMLSSGTQAADFIKVLSPTIKAANLSTGIACFRKSGISPLNHHFTLLHQLPGSPINTSKRVWQTENADLQGAWQSAWSASGGAGEGMHWASLIHTAVMVRVDGTSYTACKRVWPFAQWSRGATPGSVRVGVTGGSGLQASPYLRVDGTVAVLTVNTGTGAASVNIAGFTATSAKAFITDNTHDYESTTTTVSAGIVSGSVPGRSMITFVLEK
ncbi:uncharacterized protein PAC_01185 [Phialocephala subalpina]|uniref:Glycosyl hydrolase family 30 beta sandwich domain-containing protein n=1 Tax=Phialocephala subalpina TaxID=576137 RepID=A0A1L7WEV0_9HELO|nr:uncharacterized protein PAC_01185 [Phialocephala subalpina]